MARRSQSHFSPLWLAAAFVVAAVFLTGAWFLFRQTGGNFRNLEPLDIPTYLEYARSLRGNVYKVEGTVLNSLAWDKNKGRLISIEVKNDRGFDVLPVLVPSSLNNVNLQKGQKFILKISIGENGIIEVEELEKS
jgi:hypothetical protein